TSEPVIDSGVRFVDNAVNQVIRESAAPRPDASADPLQIWLFAASVIWAAGVAAMLLYALVAYVRLWLRIRTAVRLEGPVMLSEF
ncbi:peptidase M56, partial [Klebsiella oxytoca]